MSYLFVNGRPLVVGGKLLSTIAAAAPTTGIGLVDWYMGVSGSLVARFNIQTSWQYNDTAADVPVLFTYSGGQPSRVEARIVDGSNNATVIVPWTDITASIVVDSAGNLSGVLPNVPVGTNYKRQVRVATNTIINSTDSKPFNVGTEILLWGQSNMTGLIGGSGYTMDEVAYYTSNGTGSYFTQYGFIPGGNNNVSVYNTNTRGAGGLSLMRLTGSLLQTKFGRKVGICINPVPKNGTAMSGFMTQAGVIPLLTSTSTASGSIGFSAPKNYLASGDYRIVLWHQGETLDYYTNTRPQRLAELKLFVKAHIANVARFGRPANKITFLFAMMGVTTYSGALHLEILRGAVLDLMNDPEAIAGGWDIRIGVNCIDFDPVATGDSAGLHIGGDDLRVGMRRFTQACMNVLDPVAVPYGARGPMLTRTYTRNGNVVTLDVQHEGGMALAPKTSGSPITGWYANTARDFSGTYHTVQSVSTDGVNKVSVTVVDAGGNPVLGSFFLKHCGGKAIVNSYDTASSHPDVSNLLYDNFVYPMTAAPTDQFRGLPLLPTPDAIEVI